MLSLSLLLLLLLLLLFAVVPQSNCLINNWLFVLLFVGRYALLAGVEVQALSAFTGGVLAQEVVKISGKSF